jgi:hypothetical protein
MDRFDALAFGHPIVLGIVYFTVALLILRALDWRECVKPGSRENTQHDRYAFLILAMVIVAVTATLLYVFVTKKYEDIAVLVFPMIIISIVTCLVLVCKSSDLAYKTKGTYTPPDSQSSPFPVYIDCQGSACYVDYKSGRKIIHLDSAEYTTTK